MKKHIYLSCRQVGLALFAVLALGFSVRMQAQTINTVAGNGTAGYSGDGSPAVSKELNLPYGVALDAAGNAYIADTYNNRIRKLTPAGVISTVAGTGSSGFGSEGIPATACDLYYPYDVAFDAAGDMYIANQGTNSIRKVDHLTGLITTVAGNTAPVYAGDGLQATAASLQSPTGIAFDAAGNMYIADFGNNVVRKVNVSGIISTFAGDNALTPAFGGDGGPATAADLWGPQQVAVDASGKVFIADWHNSAVRVVNTSGIISSVPGLATGHVSGVTFDSHGNLYVAAQGVVKMVNTVGVVSTIAGGGSSLGDGGPPTAALINNATGVAVDASDDIYIVDDGHNRLREISTIVVPIDPITGATSLCIGADTILSDATPGGAWSSSNTSVATIGSAGLVTAVSAGIATISYTTSTGSVFTNISVGNTPPTGRILGLNYTCPGITVILSNYVAGVWSSSNNAISTVAASGLVTGLLPGTDTIYYTVTGSCGGTATLNFPFTVLPYSECKAGVAATGASNVTDAIHAWPNPSDGTFTISLVSHIDEEAKIVITNITGEKIKEYTTVTNKPLDITLDPSAGVYFLNAYTAHGSWSEKVLVSH